MYKTFPTKNSKDAPIIFVLFVLSARM